MTYCIVMRIVVEPVIRRLPAQPDSRTVEDQDQTYRVGPTCENARAVVGRTVTFQCPVSSSPPADVRWTLPSGRVLRREETSGRSSVTDDGSLRIRNVQGIDDGMYWCRASNVVGEESDSCNLVVIGKEQSYAI